MRNIILAFVGVLSSTALAQGPASVQVVGSLDDYAIEKVSIQNQGARLSFVVSTDLLVSGSVWMNEPVVEFNVDWAAHEAGPVTLQSSPKGYVLQGRVEISPQAWKLIAEDFYATPSK